MVPRVIHGQVVSLVTSMIMVAAPVPAVVVPFAWNVLLSVPKSKAADVTPAAAFVITSYDSRDQECIETFLVLWRLLGGS
jgi:hypothetical protein